MEKQTTQDHKPESNQTTEDKDQKKGTTQEKEIQEKDKNQEIDDEEGFEEDFEDDEEAEIGEQVPDEQLRAMGINLDEINAALNEDNRSWITDGQDDIGEDIDEEEMQGQNGEPTEADTSTRSYYDKIKKTYSDHTDAIVSLEVLNGFAFTGGMDDRLVKWNLESEKPVDSKKFTETVSLIAKREESDLLAAGFLDDKIIIFRGTTLEVLQTIKTEYDEITVS